jgi:hypothetical protein
VAKYDYAPRKRAVVAALGRWGNITLAAERAKVSRSWVERHRGLDPAFDAACRAAMAEALRTLAKAGGTRPARGWERADGVEVVIRGAPGRRTQVRRARLRGWSPSVEQRFLETLAATCNVAAACEAVGLTQASAYYHRRQWPDFLRAWDQAVETGYLKIEGALIEAACASVEGLDFDPGAPIPHMDFEQAMHLLHMHKSAVRGLGKAPGRVRRPRSLDEVRASIAAKLDAISRYRGE